MCECVPKSVTVRLSMNTCMPLSMSVRVNAGIHVSGSMCVPIACSVHKYLCVCGRVCVPPGPCTFTGLRVWPEAEALGAGAAIAARAVAAPPVVTQEAVEGALVHICRAEMGPESRVRGVQWGVAPPPPPIAWHAHQCTPCHPRLPRSPGCRRSGSCPAGSHTCRWHRRQGRGHIH